LFAVLALALLALVFLQRRQRGVLQELTRQVHGIAVGGSLSRRVELDTDQREVGALVAVVIICSRAPRVPKATTQFRAPAAVGELADRLHEAVLIQTDRGIAYANPQFASLIGAVPAGLAAQPMADIRPTISVYQAAPGPRAGG